MSDAGKADVNKVPTYEVVFKVNSIGSVTEDGLEATTNAVMEALHRDAAFIALGPVASLDFANGGIEVLCTVASDSPDALHSTMSRLSGIILDAANAFEYQGTTTHKLELVPA